MTIWGWILSAEIVIWGGLTVWALYCLNSALDERNAALRDCKQLKDALLGVLKLTDDQETTISRLKDELMRVRVKCDLMDTTDKLLDRAEADYWSKQ